MILPDGRSVLGEYFLRPRQNVFPLRTNLNGNLNVFTISAPWIIKFLQKVSVASMLCNQLVFYFNLLHYLFKHGRKTPNTKTIFSLLLTLLYTIRYLYCRLFYKTNMVDMRFYTANFIFDFQKSDLVFDNI